MKHLHVACAAIAVIASFAYSTELGAQTIGQGRLRIDLADATPIVTRSIGAGLRLVLRREVDAHGHHLGWDVSVVRGTSTEQKLRPRRPAHGPFVTDVFAWSSRNRTMPDERRLWLVQPPGEVTIKLVDYETTGDVFDVQFVRGVLEVTWRPLARLPRAAIEGIWELSRPRGAVSGHVSNGSAALDPTMSVFLHTEQGLRVDRGRDNGKIVETQYFVESGFRVDRAKTDKGHPERQIRTVRWESDGRGFRVVPAPSPTPGARHAAESWRLSLDADVLTVEQTDANGVSSVTVFRRRSR